MNFQPELAAKVMAGTKTVTRRACSDNPRSPWWRERCSLHVHRDYAVCPGRGKVAIGRVRILTVGRQPLGVRLSQDEARREGFPYPEAFEEIWRAMHGGWDARTLVWRVEFEAIR